MVQAALNPFMRLNADEIDWSDYSSIESAYNQASQGLPSSWVESARNISPTWSRAYSALQNPPVGQTPIGSSTPVQPMGGYNFPGSINIGGSQQSIYQGYDPAANAWDLQYNKLGIIPSGHESHDEWYKKKARQGQFFRDIMTAGYGYGDYAGQPLDPLAATGQTLFQAYQDSPTPTMSSRGDIRRFLNTRQFGVDRLLDQKERAMGMYGLYGGTKTAAERITDTMTDQAYAQYQPSYYMMQRQEEDKINQMLTTLSQIGRETEQTVESTGRT